jgi:F-type H+-transporting ATPase subunit b
LKAGFIDRKGLRMRFGIMLMVLLAAVCFCPTPLSAQETKHEEKPVAEAAHPQEGAKPADDHAKAGAGHDHNEFDHSHSNASASLNAPQEWKYDLAIWTLVVFLLLLLILGKFAWGPISEGLEKREHSIENMISDAKRNNDEARALLANYESKLAAQQEEYREIIAQARREGEAVQAKMLAEAQAATSRERERSVAEIEQAKNAALGEIAAKSVDVAMGLAGKIVRRQITGEDQRALLRDAVEGISSRN